MDSNTFTPKFSTDSEHIRSLFEKPTLISKARVVMVDSEARGHEGHNAIDDNPRTIWKQLTRR